MSNKINKEDVLSNYKDMISKKEIIEKTLVDIVSKYEIQVPLGVYGLPRYMNVPDIIESWREIKNAEESRDEIIKDLEIPLNLQNKDIGYLNIEFDVWKREFKNRIQELYWKDKLEIVEKNIKILKKHLSEDDLFEIDMNNFELVDFYNIQLC